MSIFVSVLKIIEFVNVCIKNVVSIVIIVIIKIYGFNFVILLLFEILCVLYLCGLWYIYKLISKLIIYFIEGISIVF